MKNIFILISFSLLFLSASKEKKEKSFLSDFKILVQSLQELHPGLYKNIDKETFDKKVNEIEERLLHITSQKTAAYIIQEFLFQLGDSHTSEADVFTLKPEKILPFKVYILNKELFIKSYDANPSMVGAKIISIENVPSEKIIDSLNIFYTNDGARNIPAFGLQAFFNSLYGQFCSQPDTFHIKTNYGDVLVPAIRNGDSLYEKLVCNSWMDYMVTDKSAFKKEITNNYGYFRFLSFDKKIDGINIRNEFKNFISELQRNKIQNAIIDLRYNSGGSPYIAGEMASYLAQKSFKILEHVFVTTQKIPTYAKQTEKRFSYRFRFCGTEKTGDQREKLRFEKGLKVVEPKKNIFAGKIYIITGDMTASAATMFCSYLMNQTNIIFVGAETSGAVNYFWAHKHCDLILPNIGTEISFPMEMIELKNGSSENEKPRGIIPGHLIHYSVKDVLDGRDKEMDWIKKEIDKKNGLGGK